MIAYHSVENRIVISSLDLYAALDREHKKYYNWIRRRVIYNSSLIVPRDYFIHRKRPMNIYMSPALAKAILVREGTIVSRNIRLYIEENIERNLSRKPETTTISTTLEYSPPAQQFDIKKYQLYMLHGTRVTRSTPIGI